MPKNPFLAAASQSTLAAKEVVRPSHLRPTHHRHVSAPMVSSSIANFVIPPPLEARPYLQQKVHRRATTSKFKQPGRLDVHAQPGPDAPETPSQRHRTDSLTSCTSERRLAHLSVESPVKPSNAGRWARDLFSWTAASIQSPAEENVKLIADDVKDQLAGLNLGQEESDDEIEVFLGLDDI